jgi:hypothetical protein
MTELIKLVQTYLHTYSLYNGAIDGLLGPNTLAGLNSNKVKAPAVIPAGFSDVQRVTFLAQFVLKQNGLYAGKIDGYYGPVTQHGVDEYWSKSRNSPNWRDKIYPQVKAHKNAWPKNTPVELKAFYGEMGKNLVSVQLPYQFLYEDGMRPVTKISCHKLVAPSLEKVLDSVLKEYGVKEIERLKLNYYAGCLSSPPRLMRGGSEYSTHSWGIALDFMSAQNQLKWKEGQAILARPEYVPFWECWELEGWTSLGRRYNYDWMHVQCTSS